MSILNIQTAQPTGLASVIPSVIYIETTDTYAQVTISGYLTAQKQQGFTFSNDQMALVKTSDEGPVWLKVVISYSGASVLNTVVSLVEISSPGDVVLPTIASHIATFTDTAGTISEDPATAISGGNIQAGLSGTAGYLASFPATALKGSLRLAGVANVGDTLVTISNASHGQATVYSIGDIGASTGGLVASVANTRMKPVAAAAAAGGAPAQSFTDAFCTTGSVVIGNWVTQTTPASVLKIVPANGSFVVTSSADAGVGTFSYIITK